MIKLALSNYEKETIINFNEEEMTATVYTYNKTLKKQLATFATKSSSCKPIHEGRGYCEFIIPKEWISVTMPKEPVSDEDKADRIAKAKEQYRKQRKRK